MVNQIHLELTREDSIKDSVKKPLYRVKRIEIKKDQTLD
jgi:hypothetical protein